MAVPLTICGELPLGLAAFAGLHCEPAQALPFNHRGSDLFEIWRNSHANRWLPYGCMLLILMTAAAVIPPVRGQARAGAMVDSLVWSEQPNQAQALVDLESGAMDAYMFTLRTANDIASAKSNPNLWTIDSGGVLNDLFVNPVPVNQSLAPGRFNPFGVPEVREALNYIIDRGFITRELMRGTAIPHTAIWHSRTPEYARDALFFSELERKYSYNPTLGKRMIFDALGTIPGVTFEAGQWKYKGTTIALNFIIRAEDVRLNIGTYIADQLQGLGFVVYRDTYLCTPFACVYNGPPNTGRWHLYTEGWASTALTAWADSDPFFFYAGGEGSRVWTMYKPEPALVDVAERLLNSRYTSLVERQILIERAAELALRNSVRIWLTAGSTTALSKRVAGLVYDLDGGPWGFLATRTARFATPGGTLQIGQRIHFLSPWNPWRGFGWLYDTLEAYAVTDAATVPHPHTGLYMPIRADYTVFTAGPTGRTAMPADAQVWDSATMGFKQVTSGTTAISIVNLTYTFGKWHDGSDFNMNDVVYEVALAFRRANLAGDVHVSDPDAADAKTILFAQTLKGFKVTGANTISMYFEYWHPDATTIASVGNVAFPLTPWTASELSLKTVFDNVCRVSEVTAVIYAKEPLDLAKGPCLAAMDAAVGGYVTANHEPPGLEAAFADAETTARWTALQTFRAKYGHFFVSNGPFILSRVDAVAVQTKMTRDANYPFDAARYDMLLTPRVPQISFGPAPQVVPGLATTFTVNSRIAGAPYEQVKIDYIITSETGDALFRGGAVRIAPGVLRVSIDETRTGAMVPGIYELRTIAVGAEAVTPVVSSQTFNVIPVVVYLENILAGQIRAQTEADFARLREQLNQQQAATQAVRDSVASAQDIAITALGSAGVALAANVAGLIVVLRRISRPGRDESSSKT